jgi:DNA-binding NarL/FixJ family response regulator
MRSILVGTRAERDHLHERLGESGIDLDVVAEFETVAEARASGIVADAVLMAMPRVRVEDGEAVFAEPLTPREIDVLELVAQGLPNKRIAERLGISDQTVKFHVASIAGKLGAANRTDAVRRAVRRGMITL